MSEPLKVKKSSRSLRKQNKDQSNICTNLGSDDQDGPHHCACRDTNRASQLNSKIDKILDTLATMGSKINKLSDVTHTVSNQKIHLDLVSVKHLSCTHLFINCSDANHTYSYTYRWSGEKRQKKLVLHGIPEGDKGTQTTEEFLSVFFLGGGVSTIWGWMWWSDGNREGPPYPNMSTCSYRCGIRYRPISVSSSSHPLQGYCDTPTANSGWILGFLRTTHTRAHKSSFLTTLHLSSTPTGPSTVVLWDGPCQPS